MSPAGSPATAARPGSVLYVGQAYYNAWYLSRELRKLGWRADVLDYDPDPTAQIYYHGADYRFGYDESRATLARQLAFYARALARYDVFHFSNANGIQFGGVITNFFDEHFRPKDEIRLLKRLGKPIVYTNNGCMDGVAKSSFAAWGERPVCLDCPLYENDEGCSDERNLAWGEFRNHFADFQILLGGNRVDYNVAPTVHEVPEFYCLDSEVWKPGLEIPPEHRLDLPETTVKLYHAVGNFKSRSDLRTKRNVKSSHIYFPLVERLKGEGHDIELIFFESVPNTELRFYQAQADIFVDMLTYGWFGANSREGMMLGKPVVCYLREEWLDQMRSEIPEYVDELPVVSATPDTVQDVLVDLIENPEKRREIGRRSREFALKWHSSTAGARRFDRIYRELIASK